VVHYATQITPILCLSIFVNSFLAVLSGKTIILCFLNPKKVGSNQEFFHISGVARGSGWQRIGGYASLGSYYLVGIPLGWFLCFVMKLRGKGLWIGILIASTIQLIVFALVTFFTNWEQEVYKLLIILLLVTVTVLNLVLVCVSGNES